jgi:hypothetical protein
MSKIKNLALRKPKNSLRKMLFEIASKSTDPESNLNEIRNTICFELEISRKLLTYYEENRKPISFDHLSYLAQVISKKYQTISVNDLIEF